MTMNRMMPKDKESHDMMGTASVESVIGASLVVKGEIQSRGTLRVDGQVEGKITAAGAVIVGENGKVEADITADQIVVGGIVKGNLIGREKVTLMSGRLYGNVSTKAANFVVYEGVIFDGICTMGKGERSGQLPLKIQEHAEDDDPSKRPTAR